jgi:hypothetical protein
VAVQHRERAGGVGEEAEGSGASDVGGVGVALGGQDVREPVAHRNEVDDLPGPCPGDEGLPAVLVGLAGADEPGQLRGGPPGLGSRGVGFDHAGLHQLHEPGPGQAVDVRGGGGVDLVGLVAGQPGGVDQAGDLAGLPDPPAAGGKGLPQAGVAVLEVQGVADQAVGGTGAGRHQQAELGARELRHQRGPVPADLLRAFGARRARPGPVRQGVLGVQGRPVRRQAQLAPLLRTEIGLVRQHRLAHPSGVQVSDPGGVELVFDTTSPTPARVCTG